MTTVGDLVETAINLHLNHYRYGGLRTVFNTWPCQSFQHLRWNDGSLLYANELSAASIQCHTPFNIDLLWECQGERAVYIDLRSVSSSQAELLITCAVPGRWH